MNNAKSIRQKYAIMRYYKNKTLNKLQKGEESSGEHDKRRGQNGINRGNYRGRGNRRGGRGRRGRGGIIQDDKRDRGTGPLLT